MGKEMVNCTHNQSVYSECLNMCACVCVCLVCMCVCGSQHSMANVWALDGSQHCVPHVNPLPGFHGNSGTVAQGGQRKPDTQHNSAHTLEVTVSFTFKTLSLFPLHVYPSLTVFIHFHFLLLHFLLFMLSFLPLTLMLKIC